MTIRDKSNPFPSRAGQEKRYKNAKKRLTERGDDLAEMEFHGLELAKKRAQKSGQSIKDVVIDDINRLRRSSYPGPECFEAHELDEWSQGHLDPGRLIHADSCANCASMINAIETRIESVDEICKDIRLLVHPRRKAIFNLASFNLDAVAVATPLLLSSALAMWLFGFVQPITGAVIVVFGLMVLVVMRFGPRIVDRLQLEHGGALITESGGALITSCFGALLLLVLFRMVFVPFSHNQETVRSVAEQMLFQSAAEAMEHKLSTGRYLDVNERHGSIVVSSVNRTENTVTYQASTDHLSGIIQIDLKGTQGVAKHRIQRASFFRPQASDPRPYASLIMASVKNIETDGAILQDPQGTVYRCGSLHNNLREKDLVMAVLDPKDGQVMNCYAVNSGQPHHK